MLFVDIGLGYIILMDDFLDSVTVQHHQYNFRGL